VTRRNPPVYPPQQVRDKVRTGSALLACAYDDEDKSKNNYLEGCRFSIRLSFKVVGRKKTSQIPDFNSDLIPAGGLTYIMWDNNMLFRVIGEKSD
jgi:hypothetical protein